MYRQPRKRLHKTKSLFDLRSAFYYHASQDLLLKENVMDNHITDYIRELDKRYKTDISREHSYRGDLQRLIEKLAPGVIATNEPAHIECGAPDYVVTKNNIPLGYIEAKDLDADLDNRSYKEQFDRYRASLGNLVITNYLEFRFYKDGEKIAAVRIGHIEKGKVLADTENFQQFESLFGDFCAYKGQSINSAAKLAKIMAGKARLLADVIKNALKSADENYENRTLRDQMEAFRKVLITDITEEEFADVYAQTVAYGMFAGRLNDNTPEDFSRQEAGELIPKSNPFLRNLFGYIAGPSLDDRIKWIVDDLADVFRAANLHDILKDFGKATKTQDPIIHFYETFLSEYDPKLRKSRGVWYTPQPVVAFIVRAVDDILKTEFELSDGLADTSETEIKIKDTKYGNAKSGKNSAYITKKVHRVQILDPATGTGTFLAEVIRRINEKFINMQGIWAGYVEEHLLPRLYGFEILMASYAMAHLKLNMILQKTGYDIRKNERLRVYLTNSLEEPHPDSGTLFATWLSEEAQEANDVKRDAPVMVVLGNPPYSVSSSNKGEWITKLCEIYKKGLNERNIQPLSDDYIKFIRYGQYFMEKNNEGILAYISNNSFLDGVIHRQMRKALLETFDKIYIVDLHGNLRKSETCPDGSKDENVFDIQQGVSINIFIKTGRKSSEAPLTPVPSPARGEGSRNNKKLAEVFHCDLYGKREAKYTFLAEHGLKDIEFAKVNYQKPYYFFTQKDFSLSDRYDKGFKVDELFKLNKAGIATGRDDLFIDMDRDTLSHKIHEVFEDNKILTLKYKLNVNDTYKLCTTIKSAQYSDENYKNLLYRPFDIRYVYYDVRLLQRARYDVMKQFNNTNIGLILSRMVLGNYNWNDVFITKYITEKGIMAMRVSNTAPIFPLYLYDDNSKQQSFFTQNRKPNLNMDIVHNLEQHLNLTFTPEKEDTAGTFAPIDVFDYIYAVLHSPTYRETYKEFLKVDFPKIPYPADKEKFRRLAGLGARLRKIHLLESGEPDPLSVGYPVTGNNTVTNPRFLIQPLLTPDSSPARGEEKNTPSPLAGEGRGEGYKNPSHRLYAPYIKELSRKKRKEQTPQEKKLWQVLRNSQTGCKFRRQFPIDNKYIADFACPEKRLIIEVDGGQHCDSVKDEERTLYLEKENFRVIRFWNNEIDNNLEGCYEVLMKELKAPLTPNPSPAQGEGKNTPSPLAGESGGVGYKSGRVYINDSQYFDGVPELCWNFYIGGYQPAQKWLKDRKGKELSYDDIKHYQKIISALYMTNEIMRQIDTFL